MKSEIRFLKIGRVDTGAWCWHNNSCHAGGRFLTPSQRRLHGGREEGSVGLEEHEITEAGRWRIVLAGKIFVLPDAL
ncbi:hypothetical protein C0Q70_00378 [Pomacea canaliculata]|uniref:Uncharacterized protein n=1 Tax=Pomacea canaliculata TaxID=400727 RepID=A0A2T7PWL1_POMCA|nr:hypothetical protein C0Q70_00378 [Pomacea canaliculata]